MLFAKEGDRDPLSDKVIGAAIEVHRHLGPGLIESAYGDAFAHELTLLNIPFKRQVPIPINYEGLQLNQCYYADFIIDAQLIVELKALEKILAVHESQLLTYMKLSNIRRGLLLDFHTFLLKDGIMRRVL